MVVNNFREKQGELVMGWATMGKYNGVFEQPTKPYAVADVRYANGADNYFVEKLLPNINQNFYGYAGWNTSANTIGSLLAGVKVKFKAEQYDENSFKRLQIIRFLDDWAYQANVRGQIAKPCDISKLMKSYEEQLSKVFEYGIKPKYTYPWNRKFEIEVSI